MKKFINRIFLFLGTLLVILVLTDITISPFLLQNDDMFSAWYEIKNDKIDCEIAFFGSSRCLNFFDCDIIEKSLKKNCYNFGISNAKIDITCLCLDYYLQHQNAPKYVTLEVGYLTLLKDNQFDHHYQLFPLLYLNLSAFEYVKSYQGFNIKQIWLPLYRYCGYIGTMTKGVLTNNNTIKGFLPVDSHWKYSIGARINNASSISIDSSKIKYLNRFVHLCELNNIKLNFVYVPEHTNYKDFYNNKQEIINFYHNYAKEKGIPFKDFSYESVFNSDTSYFHNIEHVNQLGAAKFTRDYFVPYFKQLYNLQ